MASCFRIASSNATYPRRTRCIHRLKLRPAIDPKLFEETSFAMLVRLKEAFWKLKKLDNQIQ